MSPEMAADSGVMTTPEVAEILCVCDRRVLQLAQTGELPGTKRAGRWSFKRDDVADYQAETGRT